MGGRFGRGLFGLDTTCCCAKFGSVRRVLRLVTTYTAGRRRRVLVTPIVYCVLLTSRERSYGWLSVCHAAVPVVKLPTRRRSRCCIYVTSPGRLRSCYRPVGYSVTTHDGATSHMLHPLLAFVTITFPFLPKTVLCVLAIWTLLF